MQNNQEPVNAFIKSIFKFSVPTVGTIVIMGLSMLIAGNLVSTEVYGPVESFTGYTNTIMTILVLGLDQSLIRFYNEPPKGTTKNGLFRACFFFSALLFLGIGIVCSTVFREGIYNLIGYGNVRIAGVPIGQGIIPLLFLNALFFMVIRYFIVLYRMEMSVKIYAVIVILQQFVWRLFYLVGALYKNPFTGMVAASLVGFAALAAALVFLRRRALRPHAGDFGRGVYGAILPYGIAVAPTAIFVTLNAQLPKSYIVNTLGQTSQSIYSFSYSLSNIVALVQGGFAAFWGAYMFKNYETEKERIMKVHDYLNFIILVFFSLLVAFEDVLFLFFSQYTNTVAQKIFPMMMLSAVFTILCEGTVYGNAIARRPIFDTIGIGLSFVTNLAGCIVLIPLFKSSNGLYGAAVAVVLANLVMFVVRTVPA